MTTETKPATLDLDRIYTVEEFMALEEPEGFELELWEGKIRMSPTPGDDHGSVTSWLVTYLTIYTMMTNQMGKVWDNARFVISRDPATGKETTLGPDVAFIAHPNVPPSGSGAIPRPPDLAIEVQSPGDTVPDVLDKVRKYQQAGVKLIWVIQPSKKIAAVFHQDDDWPVTIQPGGELDGEDVIPGFKLELKLLFV
jgi:Uma2 family endonuclease